ncbi:hypothetical protein [Mucilaginibacter sp.]|uniref:hypothetical protein n=1 Tax=Mucilaginibacter sp. TaxID=1882438 RepID=UPI003265A1E8
MKTLIIILIAVVLLFNLTPLSYILKEDYTYSNYDMSFQFSEHGGAGYNFEMGRRRYKRFLEKNPEKAKTDRQLYRTFTIKPWRFWQWSDYLFSGERFKLPYKDTIGANK